MPLLTSIERIAKEVGKEEVARKMLAAGIDPAQVASFTVLSLERIRELSSEV